MRKRVHLIIEGRVQGVCYRMYACEEAERLGVRGWIRNLPDGRVEAVAEGDEAAVDKFVAWCHQGPPHAKVVNVTVEIQPAGNEFKFFTIRY
ncbi:MAG: acylphosphatase [Kiritimatiellae bacterium]|nr:acylphosphatase [Kiritimatiellia bacterium]